MKEFLIDGKEYLDSQGTAELLGRAIGTIRNMTHMKKCPPFIRVKGRLYFEKKEVEVFKKQNTFDVVEIK